LNLGFTWIDVPLGQVPAVGMPHQQELADRLAADDQHTAGFDVGHSSMFEVQGSKLKSHDFEP
jgi:hypothetical protein